MSLFNTEMNKRKFKSQPKVNVNGKKIPKKYTKADKKQRERMAKEINRFKKKDSSSNPFFQWSGDTNPKTGKRYKTEKSKATKAYEKRYNN